MFPCRARVVLLGVLLLAGEPAGAAEKAPATDRHGDPLPERALVRLGSARLRVDEEVKAFAFWPDDQTLAACCADGSIRLWERATGREKRRLETGLGSVGLAAFIPGSSRVALVVEAQEVLLWDTAAGKAAWKVKLAEDDPLEHLEVSPDGKVLAVATGARKVDLVEVSSGRKLRSLEAVAERIRALVFSPDGSLLAVGQDSPSLREPARKPWVGLWDVRTGKRIRKLEDQDTHPMEGAMAFAPDGKTIAVAGFLEVVVFEIATGKAASHITFSERGDFGGDISAHALLFSADGKTLISGHYPGAIHFWDASTGKERRRRQTHDDQRAWPVLARDGKALAVASGTSDYRIIHLLDPATGKDLLPVPEGHLFETHLVAFTADGRSVLSGDRKAVHIWEAATGKPERSTRSYYFSSSWALSPDRRLLAEPWYDEIKLWDLTTGKRLRVLPYKGADTIREVAFSPDGKKLLSVHNRCSPGRKAGKSEGQDSLHVWDVATGKETQTLSSPTPDEELYAGLVVTPDGSTAIAGSIKGSVAQRPGSVATITDARGGGPLHVWDLRRGREVRTLEGHHGAIRALGRSADGRLLVSAGTDSDCRLWDLAAGKTVFRLSGQKSFEQAAAISPDGCLLAASSGRAAAPPAGGPFTIRVYSSVTGRVVLSLPGHSSAVRCLAFSPDGLRLASGFRDGTALVWDLSAAQQAVKGELQQLAARQVEALWADLAGADIVKARQAVWALAAKRDTAVRLLRERLQPAEGVERKRLHRLVAELDGDDFAVREAADRELLRLGELAEPALIEAVKGQPTLELQRRVAQLLARIGRRELAPPQLRAVRAVEVLDRIGSAEARQVLGRLAAGAAGARLTREARAALDRLSRSGAP